MRITYIAALLIVNITAYPMLAHSQNWGEERYASTVTNIRENRTTESKIVGQLLPGQKTRTDFLERNWFAVFNRDEPVRDEQKTLGYIYAPLLKRDPPSSNKYLNYKVVLKERISYLGRPYMAARVIVNEQIAPSITPLLLTAIDIWENGSKEQQRFVVFIYLSEFDSAKDAYAEIEFDQRGWKRLTLNPKP